jgi:hypothetical protein
MKQYNIPLKNVIGHFDVPRTYTSVIKYDPGRKYLEHFKKKLKENCEGLN